MIRAHPYVAVVSLLTTAAILTAGVVGVLAAASTETRHRMDSCKGEQQVFCTASPALVTAVGSTS